MIERRDPSVYKLFYEEVVAEGPSKGRLKVAREVILSLGELKLRIPPPGIAAILEGITDLAKLEAIIDR
jgi:hypothetical protein